MTLNFLRFISLLAVIFSNYACAEKSKIQVALEPFPPIITKDGQGLAINLLKEIEKISNLTFNVSIMNYGRCKRELKSERAQLIGLTPKNSETDEFYQFATELKWSLPLSVDLVVREPKKLANKRSIYIGVPTGNADFFSEMFAIPRENFIEVTSLNQLVQMLNLKRIDGIIFERIALVSTFQEVGFSDIYYRQLNITEASFAVANTAIGNILKNEIDFHIEKVDTEKIFKEYNRYLDFPSSGKLKNITQAIF